MTARIFAWLAPLTLLLASPAVSAQLINELLIEVPGQDPPREYIELRGSPGALIPTGTYLVAVEGDRQNNPGTVDAIINLGGLSYGANGFLVILPFGNLYGPQVNPAATTIVSTATGFSGLPGARWSATAGQTNFERPSASYFLIQTEVAPVLLFDIDTNNDGVPESQPAGWTVLDSIGGADHAQDMTYAQINYRKAGDSLVGITVMTGVRPGYFGRNGDSVGSTAAAWVVSTEPTGTDPNWFLATTFPAGYTGKPLNHIGGTNIWGNAPPVNNLPAAQSTNEDTALVFSALNGNAISITDTDAAGGQMLVSLTVNNGTFSLSGVAGLTFSAGDGTADTTMTFTGTVAAVNAALNGSSFLPSPNYFGPASLTINTNDQGNTGNTGALSDVDTLAITVNPVDDVPVANAQSVTTAEDTAVAITLTGSDAEGAALTFALATPAASGTAVVNPDGSASYTPNPNFNGPDSFTFTVNDGTNTSAPATVTITVTPVDDAPTANPQAVTTPEGIAAAIALTGSDPEGATLSFALAAPAANGTAVVNSDGSASYTPNANFSGSDSFTFTVSDGVNTSAPATVSITVTNVDNDAPIANPQAVTTPEDTAAAITLTGSDPEGATLTFALAAQAANGTAVVNPDGSASYTPNASFSGTDSFTFTVSDGVNTSAPATVSITVTNGDNDAPTANPQAVTTPEGISAAITLTGSDPEGATLSFALAAPAANGTAVVNPDGSASYTPNANFSGTDSFTFTVSDGVNTSAAATVSITVTNVDNDAPTANPQSVITPYQVPINITLTGSDPEGTALTFAVLTPPANGVLTGTAPNLTYTPNAGFDGPDSFTFTVSDGVNTSAPATVSITVQPNPVTNTPPTAGNDAYTTGINATLTVLAPGVLGNDTDPDAGNTLTAVLATGPSSGTLNLAANGSLTYTPATGFLGTVTFTYTANDGTANSAPATVTITVGPDALFKDGFENPPPPAAALAKVIPLAHAGSGIDTLDLGRYIDALDAEAWAAVILVDSANEIVAAFELRRTATVEVRLALVDANGWHYGAWTPAAADAILGLRWLSLDGARVDRLGVDGAAHGARLHAPK